MKNTNTIILSGIFITYFLRTIATAVIYQYDFNSLVGLTQNAIDTLPQIWRDIIYWNNYG